MGKVITPNLTASQLSAFVGSACYFNNGRSVKMVTMNFMLLYEYDKGGLQQVIPVLRKIGSITPGEIEEISKLPFWKDGFALNFIKKVGGDLFNFHLFVSEWGGTDVYIWMMQHGFDIFGWIDKDKAIDYNQEDLKQEYLISEFNELFL